MFKNITVSLNKVCLQKFLFKESYILIKDFLNEFDYYEKSIKYDNILKFCCNENDKEIVYCDENNMIHILNEKMNLLDSFKINMYELKYVEKMKSQKNILLLGFLGGLILIIDKSKKKILHHNRYHYDAIIHLEFINENYFMSTSMDYTIKIFDMTGNCYRSFTGHENYVFDADILKDKIISCDADNKLKVWNIENEKCLFSLEVHKEAIVSVLVIENKIVTGSWDKSIKILDHDFHLVKKINENCEIISLKKFYKKNFISHNLNNEIKIWNLEGKCLNVFTHQTFQNYKIDVFDKKIFLNNTNKKEFIIYSF